MRTLLALLFPLTALAGSPTELLEIGPDRITVAIDPEQAPEPGEVVAVYTSESRTDPRTGEVTEGLRYAGDGRVIWVGGDLAQLVLDHPEQPLADHLVLGPPRGADPTPWLAPEPAVPAETPILAEAPVPDPVVPEPVREPPPTIHDAVRAHTGRSQSLVAALDWSDDGYGSGIGTGSLGWSWVPERGPGRVAVRLEGLRGSRWVGAASGDPSEPWAREPAVGYWLWTEVEAGWIGLAPSVGAAVGVQQSGPAAGLSLGLRSGLPHRGHARLTYDVYGELGTRWTLLGAVPLSERVRIGPRARIGNLPIHEPPPSILTVDAPSPWRQQRADGALRLTWDALDALTLTLGGGLAGYDLLLADAGPVLDTAVEVRW